MGWQAVILRESSICVVYSKITRKHKAFQFFLWFVVAVA